MQHFIGLLVNHYTNVEMMRGWKLNYVLLFLVSLWGQQLLAQNTVMSESAHGTMYVKKSLTFTHSWNLNDLSFEQAQAEHLTFDDTYIHAHIVPLHLQSDSVSSVIDFEMDSYKEFASDMLEIKMLPPLITDNGKSIAFLRWVKWGGDAINQLIAFIPESKAVYMLTLSSNETEHFEQLQIDFEKIVQSYQVEKEIRNEITKNTFY